jgi:hypothetical protein
VSVLNNNPFESMGDAGAYFNTGASTIMYYLDKYKQYKDYYLFSQSLDTAGINTLLEHHDTDNLLSKPLGKLEVWAYHSKTLELLNNIPFPSIQASAEYLKVRENDSKIFRF